MTQRVNDETCDVIQAYMVETERRIDAMLDLIKKQKRDSSALAEALRKLHKEVCYVHRLAGLEMER